MYYIVSEISIGRRFWKQDCYFQQIIAAVAKEYLISHNLTQKQQKNRTFITLTPNATPN